MTNLLIDQSECHLKEINGGRIYNQYWPQPVLLSVRYRTRESQNCVSWFSSAYSIIFWIWPIEALWSRIKASCACVCSSVHPSVRPSVLPSSLHPSLSVCPSKMFSMFEELWFILMNWMVNNVFIWVCFRVRSTFAVEHAETWYRVMRDLSNCHVEFDLHSQGRVLTTCFLG